MTEMDPSDDLRQSLYDELRRRAGNAMGAQARDHSLRATDLVHEVWLKLQHVGGWKSRSHFLAAASQAMRRLLVDHARAKRTHKRTPPGEREDLDAMLVQFEERAIDILDLEQALKELAAIDSVRAEIVVLRFYGGATWPEVAEAVGVPDGTLRHVWDAVKLWLFDRLG